MSTVKQTPTPKPLTLQQQQREYQQQAVSFFEQLHYAYDVPGMRDAVVAALYEAAKTPETVIGERRADNLFCLYTITKHMDEIIEMRPRM